MRRSNVVEKLIIAIAAALSLLAARPVHGQYNKAWFFWMGRDHLVESRYREAIRIYNAVLRVDPDDWEAYFFRGIAKANLDDNLGAEADFSVAIDKNPVSTMAYHHRAITRMLIGNYDDALADFAQAIELRPDLSGPYYSRGYTYLMNRQFASAIDDLTTYIFHNNRVADAYILRGEAHLQMADTLRAREDFDTAIRTNRENPDGYNRRGALLMDEGDYPAALSDFQTAVIKDTTYTASYFNRALAYERLGRYADAVGDLDRVIAMNPDNPVAHYNRAIVNTTVGDYDRALTDYDRVVELSPGNVVAWYNRALLKGRRGDFEGAEADYTRAIELYPDFAAAYLARSEARFMLRDVRGSRQDRQAGQRKIAEYENRLTDSENRPADEGDPTDRAADPRGANRTDQGNPAGDGRDFRDGERNFDRLLSFETRFTGDNFESLASQRENLALLPLFRFTLHSPDTAQVVGPAEYYVVELENFRADIAMPDLVFSRLESDVPTDSVMAADRALAQKIAAGDDSWQTLFRRGVTQSLVKQFTGSVGTLSLAIDANPANPYLYINRSTTRAEMIDFISSLDGGVGGMGGSGAGGHRRLTIESDPEYRMQSSPGRIYNYDDAIADLDRAAELSPRLAYIYYNRAGLLVMSGRLPEAFDDYTRAIELNPHFAEAHYNRGLVQIYMKDTRKGYLDISKAGELGISAAYELIDKYNPNPEN